MFKFYKQNDQMDCGPTCIRMIANYYGASFSLDYLKELSETTRLGSSLRGLIKASEKIGFKATGIELSPEALFDNIPAPFICFFNQNHFVVVYKITRKHVYFADPAHGKVKYTKQEFTNHWIKPGASFESDKGIVLILEPGESFSNFKQSAPSNSKEKLRFIRKYIKSSRSLLIQLIFSLLTISIFQLAFPFLTQSIVDIGIKNEDYHFLYLIFLGQLFLFIGRITVELIRGWVLLHLSTRLNIKLISDFLVKLMALPISFFDVKLTGDIIQRIADHLRIQDLLTNHSLNTLFSLFNFIIFGCVLLVYNQTIFIIFLIGTILYFLWVGLFMKKRREIEYRTFTKQSEEQSKIIELIYGMPEIKLHNAEKRKRWDWETLQVNLFNLRSKNLSIAQIQTTGAGFINELKNILITFYAANLVMDGSISLGVMLSISYIIGQLNTPLSHFLEFIFSLQDASNSLERIMEIHGKKEESHEVSKEIVTLPDKSSIEIHNLSFRYTGSTENTLNNISLLIPQNKVTAIVGASGSGKTTLMKLLLRFYEPTEGKIEIGETPINYIPHTLWRDKTGSVMQDGFIFNDTIARNIAISEEEVDPEKLETSMKVANIHEFINTLPMKTETKIGAEGIGLSGGQKQRILIARAVYKNPDFIFFDEATSSLDSNNEKKIMNNLDHFFKGRTAVVIAHRLSTVINADQIIVMDSGKIVESGTHSDLLTKKGYYFQLVKNQLNLENIERNDFE